MTDRLKLSSGEEKVYTALWKKVTGGADTLDAGDAVGLLMESKLDEPILHEIWEFSDLDGEGYLTLDGFKIALKLVAVVQAGNACELDNLGVTTPIADLGKHTKDLEHLAKPAAAAAVTPAGADGWVISAEEKARYDESFNQLGPNDDDVITGKKARKVLLKTGLAQDVLGKIWELADIDSDGNLDRDEFAVAMHLIRSCMGGKPAPDALSADLMPPSKRDGGGGSGGGGSLAAATTPPKKPSPKKADSPPPQPAAKVEEKPAAAAAAARPSSKVSPSGSDETDWIVTPKELKTYDDFFRTADKDKDGMVSGGDIMKIFLTSKLPKDVLAHVWNLVDMDDSGEINSEQFALAMHFIAQKVKGKEVPKKLAPNMVPPSLRSRGGGGSTGSGGGGGADESGGAAAAAAPASPGGGGGGTAAELREARSTNAVLKSEIAANAAEIEKETGDGQSMLAEIKELRAEEKRLRAELKAGKDKLVEVLEQKRKAKADKKKISGKVSTLKASKAKVEQGLKAAGYYDSGGAGGGGEAVGGAPSDDMSFETHGMSMEDYFGQS